MPLIGFHKKNEDDKIGMEEFQKIFLEYFPSLCMYASKFVSDFDVSKDIAQEVLLKFWEENHKLRNLNLLKPYLYKSIKNRALNYNKRHKRIEGLDKLLLESNPNHFDIETNDASSFLSFSELKNDLENAINELPAQRRKIFMLSRFEQLKHKEIALKLNISPKTVETQIYRSLSYLREKLKHHLNKN